MDHQSSAELEAIRTNLIRRRLTASSARHAATLTREIERVEAELARRRGVVAKMVGAE